MLTSMDKESNPIIEAALAFANEVRADLDLVPVPTLCRGYKNDPWYCPLAATINPPDDDGNEALVAVSHLEIRGEGRRWPLPPRVRNFVLAVDAGAYSELIA